MENKMFENYKVFSDGKIRSGYTNKILKPRKTTDGYLQIGLMIAPRKRKFWFIHRLVATLFIPNPDKKPTVNHINNIKTDNRVENLEWATQSEQTFHQYNSNGRKSHLRKSVIQISMDNEIIKKYQSTIEAERQTNIRRSSISRCCRGILKSVGGYLWKYDNEDKNIPISPIISSEENMTPIEGFNYFITIKGIIINRKKQIIKPQSHGNNGYQFVKLSKKNKTSTKYIHRLVCETFIPNPKQLPQVNHKDKNKQNNSIDNLEWISISDNMKHYYGIIRVEIIC